MTRLTDDEIAAIEEWEKREFSHQDIPRLLAEVKALMNVYHAVKKFKKYIPTTVAKCEHSLMSLNLLKSLEEYERNDKTT